MKRVFVAIDISDEARKHAASRISATQEGVPGSGVKWIRPENLHITMRFVGDVDDEQLKALVDVAEKVSGESRKFRLTLNNVGVFPSASKARVLWIGIDGDRRVCVQMMETLDRELRSSGFTGDRKELTPHLTVARVKDPRLGRALVEKHLETQFEPVEFEVPEILIYESKLRPTGSVYSKIAGFELKAKI